jgi:neurotransmitter:Na+ symporter, NSS family
VSGPARTTRSEVFSSRWGLMVAMLGMAVGTGNIWRFPRIAATYGGGSFLVAWAVFLLIWSIPLILVEFAMGKGTRYGARRRLRADDGEGLRLDGRLGGVDRDCHHVLLRGRHRLDDPVRRRGRHRRARRAEPGALWESFSYTPAVVFYQALAIGTGVFIVARGVGGIERAARILMPSALRPRRRSGPACRDVARGRGGAGVPVHPVAGRPVGLPRLACGAHAERLGYRAQAGGSS